MATSLEGARMGGAAHPSRRIWIIDDEAQERAWLRGALLWAAKAADWPEPIEIREANTGAAWIEAISADGCLGSGDFIIADGMIGDNPIGGATLVRTWLGNRFPATNEADKPRLLMISGQGFDVMRHAFAIGNYGSVSLAKPDERSSQEFPEILSKFLAGRLDPLIDFRHAAVDIFDEAPHAFRRSLIQALGAPNRESVALAVGDRNDFSKGPLEKLEEALRNVFPLAWAGCKNASEISNCPQVRRWVRVGNPGGWLHPLVVHRYQQSGKELRDADHSLLNHVGIQVDYSWVDLSKALARVSAVSGRALCADDLLPNDRWVVTRPESGARRRQGDVQLSNTLGGKWYLSRKNKSHALQLLLMELARTHLCTELDAMKPMPSSVSVTFEALTARGKTVLGNSWLDVGKREQARRGEYGRVFGRIREQLGSPSLLDALTADGASIDQTENRFRLPVHWAYSDVRAWSQPAPAKTTQWR